MTKDDAIGRFSVAVTEAVQMTPEAPRWFQLYDWENNPVENAELLASFQLLENVNAGTPLPVIVPPTVPMFLEITTLGCRDLTRYFYLFISNIFIYLFIYFYFNYLFF